MPFPSLPRPIAQALAQKSYLEPTKVQAAVLAEAKDHGDLLVSAQTGSGKTVAFGLAIAPTLLGDEERLPISSAPLALVIAPTRELALQVKDELQWLYRETGARIASSVGGLSIRNEAANFERRPHIIVGTPGRLRDHIESKRLDLSDLKAVILDEADEMLNMGFREDLQYILEATPSTRRTLLFSATLPKAIVSLAKRYQRDAVRIDTIDDSAPHVDISYQMVLTAPHDIERSIVNLLRYHDAPNALVFCGTREAVRRLSGHLNERGFACVSLSGEMGQHERMHALQALRDGRARVCVATDVAARGLDLKTLDLVIHADLPNDSETLLHRSGRTGRAGRKGLSVLIAPSSRRRKAEGLIHGAGVDVDVVAPPSAQSIRDKDREKFLSDGMFDAEIGDDNRDLVEALLAAQPADKIAAALVRKQRAEWPEPEEISVVVDRKPVRERSERPERGERPDRGERAELGERPERGEKRTRADQGPMVWFKLALGRRQNADPKWLLPMICRVGGVTKADIGAIRIFDNETKFEIAEGSAQDFEEEAKKPNEEKVRITRTDGPEERGHRRERDGGFERKKDFGKRDFKRSGDGERARDDRGRDDRPKRDFDKKKEFGGKKDFSAKKEFGAKGGDFKKRDDFKKRADNDRRSDDRPKRDFDQKKDFGGKKDFGKKKDGDAPRARSFPSKPRGEGGSSAEYRPESGERKIWLKKKK